MPFFQHKRKQWESTLMDLKVVKDSFVQIPISSLIIRSYRMLRCPWCVTAGN